MSLGYAWAQGLDCYVRSVPQWQLGLEEDVLSLAQKGACYPWLKECVLSLSEWFVYC